MASSGGFVLVRLALIVSHIASSDSFLTWLPLVPSIGGFKVGLLGWFLRCVTHASFSEIS